MSDSPAPAVETPAAVTATGPAAATATAAIEPTPLALNDFAGSSLHGGGFGADASPELAAIGLLDDVELEVKIELGRAQMYIEDVLRLGVGSVIELDKLAGDPVDVFINERLVARGEVLVLNENLCVRINEIVNPVPEFDQAR
jgi:flagellar motor switch protein FliN